MDRSNRERRSTSADGTKVIAGIIHTAFPELRADRPYHQPGDDGPSRIRRMAAACMDCRPSRNPWRMARSRRKRPSASGSSNWRGRSESCRRIIPAKWQRRSSPEASRDRLRFNRWVGVPMAKPRQLAGLAGSYRMTARWFSAALVIGLAVTAARADEQPTRVFHIGIVSGAQRSRPGTVCPRSGIPVVRPRPVI